MTIANGCDFDDFAGLEYRREPASASRTRAASSASGPSAVPAALADSGLDVVARFVGDFRAADREWAECLASAIGSS